uniref:Macaca fascicularis brain cDNA, clone: QflA-20162 n=1 Tax=Macaca fascicularis TaxID=9541 RepID=I7GLZ3_MACFA|nr:unnamed protein product [Macaca fascicularis]
MYNRVLFLILLWRNQVDYLMRDQIFPLSHYIHSICLDMHFTKYHVVIR